MPKVVTQEPTFSLKIVSTCLAGAVASLITQPLEVIKTNRINSPSSLYRDIHEKIIRNGWSQYMRGSSIAVIRQAYGFTFYTQMLSIMEHNFNRKFPNLNKIMNYSVSSVMAKLIAMIFQSPLTLLKTRIQMVGSLSLAQQSLKLLRSPFREYTKGLGSSVAREGLYTLFHYTSYRLLKDDLFHSMLNIQTTFIPAFIAGIIAITVSQPFEVLRSQISINKIHEPLMHFIDRQYRVYGWKGFFIGYLPRLLRKPINSGICWTIVQYFKKHSEYNRFLQ